MVFIALALRLSTLTLPVAGDPPLSEQVYREKPFAAKNWVYKARGDLRQSYLFPNAFPVPCYPSIQRVVVDGYPPWTRFEFAVFLQRVVHVGPQNKKPVPPRLQKEIQRLETEFRAELRMLEGGGTRYVPSEERAPEK